MGEVALDGSCPMLLVDLVCTPVLYICQGYLEYIETYPGKNHVWSYGARHPRELRVVTTELHPRGTVSTQASDGPEAGPSYRGTSLIRNCPTLAPYSRFMSRALWWS